MVRCPGFKFHANAAFLLFCLITLKSQYSNHTCITLGIIVSCSGIGETDATLKVVSACTSFINWTQDYKYCCVLQQIKALEAEIEELKRQLSQKKSKTSEYTHCTEESQITVFTDNFIIQDSYQIESFHKFGTIRLATRRPVSPYDL